MKNPNSVALGKLTKKKYGHKHYVKIGKMGGRKRKFTPCPTYRAHVWDKNEICYGCHQSKEALSLSGQCQSV